MNVSWAPAVVGAVAAGGAFGALARYAVYVGIGRDTGGFPLATLLINVAGSFAIGWFFVYFQPAPALPDPGPSPWREGVSLGFLGAFTTFSAFSFEALALLQKQQYGMAAGYVLGSVAAGVLAAWIGIHAGRWMMGA